MNPNYDSSQPWPSQFYDVHGERHEKPAENNYTYGNRDLPAARSREEFISAFENHPVVIWAGETGSGKTTQGVQYAHESGVVDMIYQTQPRVLLARKACERVREEMGYAQQEIGAADKLVGYTTGFDSDLHKDNKIISATHGKLVRRLLNDPNSLKNSAVMADEFHLRGIDSDIVAALCAKYGIKLILASATIDTERTARVFANHQGESAPIVEIAMRQHKIDMIEGTDNIFDDAAKYVKESDSMIFLTGRKHINSTIGKVTRRLNMVNRHTNAIELHGEQTKEEQQRAFDTSYGFRTIYSTNVGEMGVTPDVDVVINPGYERASILIEGVETLTERPASQAKNKQRAGRTGRTRPGTVIFGSKMPDYPKLPPHNQLPEFDIPEIQTIRLDRMLLDLSVRGETFDTIFETLGKTDMPAEEEVSRARIRLRRLGAFDSDNNLTEIGRKMVCLPLDPHLARMFVELERFEGQSPYLTMQMAALVATAQEQGIGSHTKGQDSWKTLFPSESLSEAIYGMKVFGWATDKNRTRLELQKRGIIEPKLIRAKNVFKRICEQTDIDMTHPFETSIEQTRDMLLSCIVAGTDEVFVKHGKDSYLDARGDRRFLQNGSKVGKTPIIIGTPWNLQSYRKEALHIDRYITSPTVVTRKQLEENSPDRCTYAISGYHMDGWGNITAKRGLYFDGQFVDDSERVSTEPNAQLRDYMVASLFDKSMVSKKDLPLNIATFCKEVKVIRYQEQKIDFNLEIEKKLGEYEEYLKTVIPETVWNFEDLNEYIDPSELESIIDDEHYEEIQRKSPDVVSVAMKDGEMIAIPVEYHQNQVRLMFTLEQLDYLPEYFPEFEGRDVKIRIGSRTRLMTIEEAFDRALNPNRAHWRNSVRPDEPISMIKRSKDEDWDGSTIQIAREPDAPNRLWQFRTQHKV